MLFVSGNALMIVNKCHSWRVNHLYVTTEEAVTIAVKFEWQKKIWNNKLIPCRAAHTADFH